MSNPQPEKKLKSGPYLSAACRNGKHDKCWSISCTCQCGHGVYAGMPKKVVQDLKRIAEKKRLV